LGRDIKKKLDQMTVVLATSP